MNLPGLLVVLSVMLGVSATFAQGQSTPSAVPGEIPTANATAHAASEAPDAEPPGGSRVFGVLPNCRTADASQEGTVLTPRQKLDIASKDSFDYPLVALAGALAGLGQLTNQAPSTFSPWVFSVGGRTPC